MSVGELKQSYLKISNINLYCEYVITNKPSIFLIHGFASSTYTFRKLIPLLQKQFSVIAVDLPGFGKSEKATSFVYTFQNYANILIECMNKFELASTSIVAHSMGGQIALNMARTVPKKIDKLVLLCSSGYLKRAKKLLIYSSYLPFFENFVRYYVTRKEVRDHLRNVFYNQTLINDELIQEFGRPLLEKDFYKALTRLLRHREGDLLPHQLKEIDIPTLLIWGKEDRVVPVDIGERLARDLPNSQLITYDNTGHLISEERPFDVYGNILMHNN